jgi:hypothetical protein
MYPKVLVETLSSNPGDDPPTYPDRSTLNLLPVYKRNRLAMPQGQDRREERQLSRNNVRLKCQDLTDGKCETSSARNQASRRRLLIEPLILPILFQRQPPFVILQRNGECNSTRIPSFHF